MVNRRGFFDVKEKIRENEERKIREKQLTAQEQVEKPEEQNLTPELIESARSQFKEFETKIFTYRHLVFKRKQDRSMVYITMLFIFILLWYGVLHALSLRKELYLYNLEEHFKNAKYWELLTPEEVQEHIKENEQKEAEKSNINVEEEIAAFEGKVPKININDIELLTALFRPRKSIEDHFYQLVLNATIASSFGYVWGLFRNSLLWFSFVKKAEYQHFAKYSKLPFIIAQPLAKRSALVLACTVPLMNVLQAIIEENTVSVKKVTPLMEKHYLMTDDFYDEVVNTLYKQAGMTCLYYFVTAAGSLFALYHSRYVFFPILVGAFWSNHIFRSPFLRREVTFEGKFDIYHKKGEYAKLCRELEPVSESTVDIREEYYKRRDANMEESSHQ